MALAADRVDLLIKDISSHLSELFVPDFKSFTWKDWLALLGAIYASKKAFDILREVYLFGKQYGASRVYVQDLSESFGPWAVVTGSTHGIGKAYAQELAAQNINIIIVSLDEDECNTMATLLVVTGCTSGLGRALVLELAAAGVDLVLVSRNAFKLQQLQSDLETKFGVQAHAIAVDFSEGEYVFDQIRDELSDKEIGILVNNVGVNYDYPQCFLDVPEEKLWQLVRINVATATMMTKMVLPQMVSRNRGAVITVSAASCSIPTPQMTVYSATKSYLDFLMRGLAYEYHKTDIVFQCLTPFFIATRMTQYRSDPSTSLWIPSATSYAQHALYTLGWSAKTTGYWPHTIQEWVVSLFPDSIRMWIAMRLNNGFRRQAINRIRHRSGGAGVEACSSRFLLNSSPSRIPRSRSGSLASFDTGMTSLMPRSRSGSFSSWASSATLTTAGRGRRVSTGTLPYSFSGTSMSSCTLLPVSSNSSLHDSATSSSQYFTAPSGQTSDAAIASDTQSESNVPTT